MSLIQPKISVLTQEQIEEIHSKSLDVLSRTGIRIDSIRGKSLFEKAVGKKNKDQFIRIPAELVESAINSAPSIIDIYTRTGEKLFVLDGKNQGKTYFGTGVTNLYYEDPLTGTISPFTRENIKTTTMLGQKLDNFDIISTPGIIQDIPARHSDLYSTLDMVTNTIKPLVILVSENDQFKNVIKLLQFLFGDLESRPFIIPYVNPVTPLVLNEGTVDKMFDTITNGLPLIFSNYGMSGATTPITPAGTLVLLNAELLAGLVLSQLIREGAPVILGALPAVFDNKSMISSYPPQTMLLNLACAEMMNFYGIPHCGTSGSGPGWGADLQASGTLWMNHLTSCIGRVGLAPFVGGNFSSTVYSPATVIYSDEIIRQARLFKEAFELDDSKIGLDEINLAGPGGNFLTSDLTLSGYRMNQEQHSNIWPGISFEEWKKKGSPKTFDILREYSINIMSDLQPPKGYYTLKNKGEEFIKTCQNKLF